MLNSLYEISFSGSCAPPIVNNLLFKHAWATAALLDWYYKELLRSPRQALEKVVGPVLADSLEFMTHCRDVASSSLFHRYYLDELVELISFPLPYPRSTRYVDSIHNLAVSIPRLWKEIYANSFFPCIIRHWSFLPAYCFPLTYNLNRF